MTTSNYICSHIPPKDDGNFQSLKQLALETAGSRQQLVVNCLGMKVTTASGQYSETALKVSCYLLIEPLNMDIE